MFRKFMRGFTTCVSRERPASSGEDAAETPEIPLQTLPTTTPSTEECEASSKVLLLDLPNELLLVILGLLPQYDLRYNLPYTCRRLKDLSEHSAANAPVTYLKRTDFGTLSTAEICGKLDRKARTLVFYGGIYKCMTISAERKLKQVVSFMDREMPALSDVVIVPSQNCDLWASLRYFGLAGKMVWFDKGCSPFMLREAYHAKIPRFACTSINFEASSTSRLLFFLHGKAKYGADIRVVCQDSRGRTLSDAALDGQIPHATDATAAVVPQEQAYVGARVTNIEWNMARDNQARVTIRLRQNKSKRNESHETEACNEHSEDHE